MAFDPPYPSKQLAMHQLLIAARQTVLHGALSEALAEVDPDDVAAELKKLSPAASRRILAGAGIRDEHVFAAPTVLAARPTTLGYYRLLLGVSQKQFYTADTGFSTYKPMEEKGTIPKGADLSGLCKAMNASLGELVAQLDPVISAADLQQLPVLTLGMQFDGSHRNGIGKAATAELFLVIREIVEPFLTSETLTELRLDNSSGRKVRIVVAADPDVAIWERFGDDEVLNVAIENKGGTDRSNAHNRAGEAEKSHQKYKDIARDFWTVIATKGVSLSQLRIESPTTNEWFNVSDVLGRKGEDFDRFKLRIAGAVGISI